MPLLLPRESDADSITAPTLITSFTSPTPPSFTLPTPSPSSSSSASSSSTDSASENLDSTSQSFTKVSITTFPSLRYNVLQWLIVGLAILVLASVIRDLTLSDGTDYH
ncbi:hypothetical protein GYMLUDRAFT_877999 [Collybiopsis luxurians FD-317 M1]|nr:hypothetical protein GYMLUDRAFT_877999 [Collybiopsis luxurians FD-317 M1]